MGRNRRVLEDNLSEAVWRTILRGPRPPSVQWPQSRRNVSAVDDPRSKKGKGKGQGPGPVGKGSGKMQGSNTVRAGHLVVRKSPTSSLNPDEQVAAAQVRVTKLEAAIQVVGGRSCSSGIEGGFAESPHPNAVAAGPRLDKSHRGFSEPVPEEVRDHDVRSTEIKRGHHRIGVENPGYGLCPPFGVSTGLQAIFSQTVHCLRVHRGFFSFVGCAVCQSRYTFDTIITAGSRAEWNIFHLAKNGSQV